MPCRLGTGSTPGAGDEDRHDAAGSTAATQLPLPRLAA